MFAKLAAALAVCVVIGISGEKVCTPVQWTAAVLGKVAQVTDGKVNIINTSGISYFDYDKKKEAIMQNVTLNDGTVIQMTTLSDFAKNKTYEIYPKYMKCDETDLPDPSAFKRYCIGDDDLKLVGSLSIGGKMANVYEMPSSGSSTIMTVMRDNFSPVSSATEQTHKGVPQSIVFQYGNVTAEVTDPSVFDLPSYCQKSNPQGAQKRCAPAQWEGTALGRVAQVVNGKPMVLFTEISQSRDFTNKMESTYSETKYMNKTYRSRHLFDWNKKEGFRIDLDTQKCLKINLPTPAMVQGCEDELDYVTSFTVDGEMASMYQLKQPATNTSITMTLFSDTFLPITSVNEQNYLGIPQMIYLQYGNITTGISDPSVFKIPDYCSKAAPIFG